VFATRWNHIYNNRLFGNITIGYTRFYYNIIANANKFITETHEKVGVVNTGFNSTVSDVITKADFDYYPSNKHHVKFGGTLIYHKYNPSSNFSKLIDNNITLNDTAINSPTIKAIEMSLYAEDEFTVTDAFSMNIGIRFTGFVVDGKKYYSPEPRFTANYAISSNSSLKASYAYMTQPIHLLSNSGVGLPADLWVPATVSIKPETSHQIVLGFLHRLPEKLGLDLTVEAFYKHMDNLIDFKEGLSFFSGKGDWQNKVESGGKGEVFGVEFLIEKKEGKTTGWLAYTLSRNTRQFANINSGLCYPYVYDHTHDISLVVNQHVNDHITLSAIWVYSTGNAITMPTNKNIVNTDFSYLLY
jgi:outer membrane receptor for ferrienterochelin and colicin